MKIPVTDKKLQELKARQEELQVLDSDLEMKFIQGGGKGGQKINKSANAVVLKHLPTGIVVKCQKERSQALNRFFALRELLDEIERANTGSVSAEEKAREKIRKQKQRRKRRSTSQSQTEEDPKN